jgi:hypothetical protein
VIEIADGDPFRRSTTQHIELVTKDKDFGFAMPPGQALPHQIKPQRSPIGSTIGRFAGWRQPILNFRQVGYCGVRDASD